MIPNAIVLAISDPDFRPNALECLEHTCLEGIDLAVPEPMIAVPSPMDTDEREQDESESMHTDEREPAPMDAPPVLGGLVPTRE